MLCRLHRFVKTRIFSKLSLTLYCDHHVNELYITKTSLSVLKAVCFHSSGITEDFTLPSPNLPPPPPPSLSSLQWFIGHSLSQMQPEQSVSHGLPLIHRWNFSRKVRNLLDYEDSTAPNLRIAENSRGNPNQSRAILCLCWCCSLAADLFSSSTKMFKHSNW